MRAIRLRTEYLSTPIGIEVEKPRFFWNCEDGRRQAAYQIMACTEEGALLWDSQKVETNAMHAVWEGNKIPPRTKVLWKVRLWAEEESAKSCAESDLKGTCTEEAGKQREEQKAKEGQKVQGKQRGEKEETGASPGEWTEDSFETGIDIWRAEWITGNYKVDPKKRYPVDCFRKKFQVSSPLKKARLYITACGLYEACLNEKKAGDFMLAPGITDYRKRVQYQTIDVTDLLKEGENALTVQLADGWYRGSCGAWGRKNQYGRETKLLAELILTYKNGVEEHICSGTDWEWSNDGPILFADNKDGERIDARKAPSFAGKAKKTSHSVIPTASNNVPLREKERLSARLLQTPSGKQVLDFGQNIAGILSFSLMAGEGEKLTLSFGEMLDARGEFTQKNIQCSNKKLTTPLQKVEYLCREGRNDYKTTFAIFGFQYVLVEIEGARERQIRPEDFTAIAVYSDLERTGFFESSNQLLNQLFEATVWSAKNNHADLPTDCPTRERHGWAGDAQIFCRTADYLFDYAAFAGKYEKDLADAQHKNGCFTQIAPVGGVDPYMNTMDGSPGWSDAGVLIPLAIYEQYGDRRILKENYEAMCRFARYKERTLGKHYLTSLPTGIDRRYRKDISNYGQSYGEWAEPEDVNAFRISDFVAPHPEETTAYIVLLMESMEKIAKILGKDEDAAEFHKTAERVRTGYQHLVESSKFSLDTDRQAKLVRPLFLKLLTKEQEAYAKDRLLKALDHYGWRLGTGFLSTPMILYVLGEIDISYAYRLLENEELPGWLCMPKLGATTIWENWEGTKADKPASLNHYSKGAVCQWLFDTMCGIRVAGENHFILAPKPGGHFTYAKASYNSIYGKVESSWRKEGERYEYTFTVPDNCTASIELPGREAEEVMPGTYVREVGSIK